jgi:serine/threonine protein kinase
LEEHYDSCGTPGYQAPELMLSEAYGTKADVWGAGMVLAELMNTWNPLVSAHLHVDDRLDIIQTLVFQ